MNNISSTIHRVDYFDIQMTELKEAESYPVQIFIAGDLNTARAICRQYCMGIGLCVNVMPTEYIYTGGSEMGVRVELINYPRFPSEKTDILYKAKELMYELMFTLCQNSATVQTPDKTYWFSRREKGI